MLTSHRIFVSEQCLNKSQSFCLLSCVDLIKLGVTPAVWRTVLFVDGVGRLAKIQHLLDLIKLGVTPAAWRTVLFVDGVGRLAKIQHLLKLGVTPAACCTIWFIDHVSAAV